MSYLYSCFMEGCSKICKSAGRLTQHLNNCHFSRSAVSPQDRQSKNTQVWRHPHLTGESYLNSTMLLLMTHVALICDEDGQYISPQMPPPARQPLDATPKNPFHLFQDRLAFEFADYHFSQQQSS